MAGKISIRFTAKDQFTRVSEKMNRALDKNRRSFKRLDDSMRKSSRVSDRSSRRMLRNISKVSRGFAALAVGGGVVAAGKNVADRTLMIEKQVIRQLGNVDVARRPEMEPILRRKLLETERTTGLEFMQVSDALFEFSSLLGTSSERLKQFDDVAKIAVSSLADPVDVATGTGKAIKTFPGLQNDPNAVRELGMMLSAAQQVGGTSVGKLFGVLPSVSPQATLAGFTAEDFSAVMAGITTKMPSTTESGTALSDLLRSLRVLTPNDKAFGKAMALGLPAGPDNVRRFIETQGPEELLARSHRAMTGRLKHLVPDVFSSVPATALAGLADEEMIRSMRAARSKIVSQRADPTINALNANFEAMTSGPLAAAIDTKAVLKNAQTKAGEAVVDAAVSASDALGDDGVIGRVRRAHQARQEEGALNSENFMKTDIMSLVEALNALSGPFGTQAQEVDVKIEAGPGLIGTTGSTGDQTRPE